ncbi:MAG TPA: hypothetical protein VGL25_13735 [Casimicrobiaceae bacterium]
MTSSLFRISALSLLILGGCGTTPPTTLSSKAPETPTSQASPDPARVYADLLGRTEDLPRVVRSLKEYEGRSIVLYGLRSGELRPTEGRFSMPLAATDGKTVINAIERPANNQFYLVIPDDFAREARDRKMLVSGTRGPVFVECKVNAQTVGRAISYPCDVVSLVVVTGDRVSDSLWRSRDQKLEYHRY